MKGLNKRRMSSVATIMAFFAPLTALAATVDIYGERTSTAGKVVVSIFGNSHTESLRSFFGKKMLIKFGIPFLLLFHLLFISIHRAEAGSIWEAWGNILGQVQQQELVWWNIMLQIDTPIQPTPPGNGTHFTLDAQSEIYSTIAMADDGTLYFASWNGMLYAINPNTATGWSHLTGGNNYGSPTIGPDGTIYVGSLSEEAKLYALHPNGNPKWEISFENKIPSTPAIGNDGTIYVGAFDYKLHAVKPDGTQKWTYQTGAEIVGSPAIGDDGTIYIGSNDTNLYAINPDGSLKWKFPTGDKILSSPAVGLDGTVYVGSDDKKLYAIKKNGVLRWSFATEGKIQSSPTVGGDQTVYIGSFDNRIYAISADDGNKKWDYQTGAAISSTPAIGIDGTIYVGSDKIYALSSEGAEVFSIETDDFIYSSPTISNDGTLYVADLSGKIYIVHTDCGGPADSPWPMFHADSKNRGSVLISAITDNDDDGISNELDNCPDVFNPDQADANGDGVGDLCSGSTTLKGDINGNGFVDLSDAILSLQIIISIAPAEIVSPGYDVNNDNKVGLSEAIYVLRVLAQQPPTTVAGPSVSSTTVTGTTLTATINENGTGYYLVQPATAAGPNSETVVAAGHSFSMAAYVQATVNISGLTGLTTYKVYFVAEDTAGNIQTTVQNVGFTTGDTPPPDVQTVTSTGQVWMDRNLGASRVATSATDAEAYGDLYQWGRGSDGHEKRTSPTTSTLSTSDTPGHGSFIMATGNTYDWRTPRNDNLWQGVSGINNPCPAGFRSPTDLELETERVSWSSNNSAGAFASPLKLVVAGYRNHSSGSLNGAGSYGSYWSSTVNGGYARGLHFDGGDALVGNYGRAAGVSVRCLKD